MFLVNSRLGQFSAAPFLGHPLSLSYGVILPSSLTTVLSLALGYSPHPHDTLLTHLCRFAVRVPFISLETFLDSVKSAASLLSLAPHRAPALIKRISLSDLHQHLVTHNQLCAQHILLCHPFSQSIIGSTGISTCYPSPTPFGLSLGPD